MDRGRDCNIFMVPLLCLINVLRFSHGALSSLLLPILSTSQRPSLLNTEVGLTFQPFKFNMCLFLCVCVPKCIVYATFMQCPYWSERGCYLGAFVELLTMAAGVSLTLLPALGTPFLLLGCLF